MLPRTPEPELMLSVGEVVAYDQMDHAAVNQRFVDDLLEAWQGRKNFIQYDLAGPGMPPIDVVDLGTGTAQIPILLCQQDEDARCVAVDGSPAMLDVAIQNIDIAGLRDRISLQRASANSLPNLGRFDIVMSNSLVHHLHNPEGLFASIRSLLSECGLVFFRDLTRPATEAELESIVSQYAGDEASEAQRMFRESLHAAFTVDEICAFVEQNGYDPTGVTMTSDRHWTWVHN